MSQENIRKLKRVLARDVAATVVALALALVALVKTGLIGLVPW